MNYAAHYDRLISRARSRALEGYRERHHVLPKCMGGGNGAENIVELTAEEHYVAHQLLCKIYPEVRGLAIAAVRMAKRATGSKAYGWLKRRHSMAISEANRRRTPSPEQRAKASAALLGRKRPPMSAAWREKLSAANLGKTLTPETRAKMSAAGRGKKKPPRSPEHRAKMSAANRGKKFPALSTEHRAKIAASMSVAMRGKKNALGHIHSPESRAKMSAARRAYVERQQGVVS